MKLGETVLSSMTAIQLPSIYFLDSSKECLFISTTLNSLKSDLFCLWYHYAAVYTKHKVVIWNVSDIYAMYRLRYIIKVICKYVIDKCSRGSSYSGGTGDER